jgi:tripartite-type tricarboxylate transporter receptor subunit TctC
MKLPRRKFLHLAAGAAAFPAVSRIARAQAYPSRPITIIVPFPAGGTTDVVARVLADRMKVSLGQSIIIENVSGANGSTGVGRAARATPDGYTIDLGQWGTHVVNGAMYALRYDLAGDFEPIAPVVTIPLVLYARKAMPGNDLNELISWLKANPDKATHGNATAGLHAVAALFQKETGTSLQFVPYRGEAPALQDLLAGQIDLMWNSPNSLVQVRAGGIKAYVVTAKARLTMAPDIPTAEEAGLRGLSFSSWYGLFAPKSTPRNATDKINAAAVEALADSAVRQRFADIGLEVFPRDQQTSEVLGALVKADIEKWWPIIKAANIKVD